MSTTIIGDNMGEDIFIQLEFNSLLITVYVILLLLMLLFGLLTNVLLCATIVSTVNLRLTSSNMYVYNMACAHIIASFVGVFTVDNILQRWITGEVVCKITYYVLHVTDQMVSCIILILHLDEYIKLKHFKLYQRWSMSGSLWKGMMVMTWAVLSICNIPQFFYQEVRRSNASTESLVCSYDYRSFPYKLHSSYVITIHVITLFVTLCLNIVIQQKLYSSKTTSSGGNAILLEKRKHMLKIFSVLFLLHSLSTTPKIFAEFVHDHEIHGMFPSSAWLLFQFLYFSRYSCCTITYIIMNKKCFEDAKELMKCIKNN